MKPTYKTPYTEFELNEEFWREVMVGRTITDVKFSPAGMQSFILDSEEEVFTLHPASLSLRLDDERVTIIKTSKEGPDEKNETDAGSEPAR